MRRLAFHLLISALLASYCWLVFDQRVDGANGATWTWCQFMAGYWTGVGIYGELFARPRLRRRLDEAERQLWSRPRTAAIYPRLSETTTRIRFGRTNRLRNL